MRSAFVIVGPVRRKDLVGLAAEQEVEVLEDALELFAALLTEIGHRPAAELEALGGVLGRPAGRLHDAIDGNLGTDYNFPHGSLSRGRMVVEGHKKNTPGVGLRPPSHCLL